LGIHGWNSRPSHRRAITNVTISTPTIIFLPRKNAKTAAQMRAIPMMPTTKIMLGVLIFTA
jgi:hypothetical protein